MIKTFIFVLLFSTTLLAAGSYSDNNSDNVASSSAEDQINKLYNKAYELVYAKKFDKSIKLLKKIAKRNDLGLMKADIYNLLGYSYRKNDNPDLDKAFESYKIAIEVDPEHLGAHEYLGELYFCLLYTSPSPRDS